MKKCYYYLADGKHPIRVYAKYKPSLHQAQKGMTWSLREYDGTNWIMPVIPEVTYGALSKMTYIGFLRHYETEL